MHPVFMTEKDCPTNRDRLNAWYRKRLPYLVKRGNTWSRLRVRGEAIKRQWRAYWAQRDALKAPHITPFPGKAQRPT